MALTTYNTCSFSEKRDVLRTFWSARDHESEKINTAAREYGPYALALIVIITVELAIISALLVALASGWSWIATAATVLSLWSVWWTRQCQRRLRTS